MGELHTHPCLKILFSILKVSSNVDVIHCNILPIDVIILGRPWLYDYDYSQLSRLNQGQNSTSAILVPCLNFITIYTLHKEFETRSPIWFLYIKEVIIKTPPDAPYKQLIDVQQLVERYKDILPNDIPYELPLMQDIHHQHNELKYHITKLLKKGFIRESLNPCAIPTLLTLKKDVACHMCVDSRVVKKITIKYYFIIPELDDMLDMLVGSNILPKIDLKSEYHQC
ncbi:unnamed protein product [Spirodela intermedia]|uniref:Uncharacterized protein n=1 Tax=Spirodela intermedia TaxID=51605 RepID=A0A7I8LBL1_SPIIN|nr:unnamed protein product [Spirodela intermedia]